jgi:hypothetical protein
MMATTTHLERVTRMIPADCIDDFRVGVVAVLKFDADGFGEEHVNMLDARDDRRDTCREDRGGRLRHVRETCALLTQLPDEDVETTVSGAVGAFSFALEEAGRLLVERLRSEFEYVPVPVEDVLPLLNRLRWTIEQVVSIEAAA